MADIAVVGESCGGRGPADSPTAASMTLVDAPVPASDGDPPADGGSAANLLAGAALVLALVSLA